jgi:hypothetical protein
MDLLKILRIKWGSKAPSCPWTGQLEALAHYVAGSTTTPARYTSS